MKTIRSPRLILLAASACCALATPHFALAQPQAPAAAVPKEKKPKKGDKPKDDKKPRGRNLTPRVVAATEAALGKPLTPELTEQLMAAMRERDAALKAANDAYYAAFAKATGLTPEQAKEIDKPARNGPKPPTKPKVEGTTNMDALTETDNADEAAPVTPK